MFFRREPADRRVAVPLARHRRGIGQLAFEAIGIHDAPGFIFSAVVLAAHFATLSALADLSRPKDLYQAS